jgi:hypothetical protein
MLRAALSLGLQSGVAASAAGIIAPSAVSSYIVARHVSRALSKQHASYAVICPPLNISRCNHAALTRVRARLIDSDATCLLFDVCCTFIAVALVSTFNSRCGWSDVECFVRCQATSIRPCRLCNDHGPSRGLSNGIASVGQRPGHAGCAANHTATQQACCWCSNWSTRRSCRWSCWVNNGQRSWRRRCAVARHADQRRQIVAGRGCRSTAPVR